MDTQESTTNDDPILQKLTSMGYARSVALNALEKYDYNVDRVSERNSEQREEKQSNDTETKPNKASC